MSEGRRELSSALPSEQDSEDSRIGPLLIEHHRKDDGRALILYREAGAEDEDG
jgi:hypothetical protein